MSDARERIEREVYDFLEELGVAGGASVRESYAISLTDRLLALLATPERGEKPKEGVCQLCGRTYPVWFAPNGLWNRIMRLPDGSDRWPFVCPTCFADEAHGAGVDVFVVANGAWWDAHKNDSDTAARAIGALPTPRYSREDFTDAVGEMTRESRFFLARVPHHRLRLWAAMLSEAANRAPTHRELVEMINAKDRP